MHSNTFKTIDAYIDSFPPEIKVILHALRRVIREEAPDALETISYQMPTFKLDGKNMVHFAAYPKHIGFYPTPSAILAFKHELKVYKTSKGTIQFPLDQPLPLPLIRQIVQFRIKEIEAINLLN